MMATLSFFTAAFSMMMPAAKKEIANTTDTTPKPKIEEIKDPLVTRKNITHSAHSLYNLFRFNFVRISTYLLSFQSNFEKKFDHNQVHSGCRLLWVLVDFHDPPLNSLTSSIKLAKLDFVIGGNLN